MSLFSICDLTLSSTEPFPELAPSEKESAELRFSSQPPPAPVSTPFTARWELDAEDKHGSFLIKPYKPTYMLLSGVVAAFLLSFFFSACTIIYALLRKHVDGENFDRIFTCQRNASNACVSGTGLSYADGLLGYVQQAFQPGIVADDHDTLDRIRNLRQRIQVGRGFGQVEAVQVGNVAGKAAVLRSLLEVGVFQGATGNGPWSLPHRSYWRDQVCEHEVLYGGASCHGFEQDRLDKGECILCMECQRGCPQERISFRPSLGLKGAGPLLPQRRVLLGGMAAGVLLAVPARFRPRR